MFLQVTRLAYTTKANRTNTASQHEIYLALFKIAIKVLGGMEAAFDFCDACNAAVTTTATAVLRKDPAVAADT
ncbi:MAG TPA: hypothetical protein VNS22_13805 [Geminicoccus sp.]|uniref:hypothetical protein n=1 Tax=Geminicoccus sp. TaxID=2024832 RepID=UPI002C23F8CD|nr:hypothetical protein [Geminicoccus sp.]HWL69442.1 hypothetical protein [Geminicoccus sp.]